MNRVARPAHPHYPSDITCKPFHYSEQIALATMHTKDAKPKPQQLVHVYYIYDLCILYWTHLRFTAVVLYM